MQEEIKKKIVILIKKFQFAPSNKKLTYKNIEATLYEIDALFEQLKRYENSHILGAQKVKGTLELICPKRKNESEKKKTEWAREQAENLYLDLNLFYHQ